MTTLLVKSGAGWTILKLIKSTVWSHMVISPESRGASAVGDTSAVGETSRVGVRVAVGVESVTGGDVLTGAIVEVGCGIPQN